MDILEKDTNTNDNDKEIIEKVNEDFLDTIKQALHISNGLLCDLTDEELHDIKFLQQDAYKNLKGDTDFNLYPLCLAELYKNILDNIYKHQIDDYKKEKTVETILNDSEFNYKHETAILNLEETNSDKFLESLDNEDKKDLSDESIDKDYEDINAFLRDIVKQEPNEYIKFAQDYTKVIPQSMSQSQPNENKLENDYDYDVDTSIIENDKEKKSDLESNAEQHSDIELDDDLKVVQRFDISLDEDDSQNKNKETDSFVNPFPEEEELEGNSELLKHVDTLEILSDEDTQNFSLEEIHEEENRKVITSESIEESTTDKAFTNEAESIEDVLPDEGIEIKNEIEDEPVDFSNLKFFSDRNIDD